MGEREPRGCALSNLSVADPGLTTPDEALSAAARAASFLFGRPAPVAPGDRRPGLLGLFMIAALKRKIEWRRRPPEHADRYSDVHGPEQANKQLADK